MGSQTTINNNKSQKRIRMDKGRKGENDYRRRRVSPIRDVQALSVFNKEL